MVWHGVAVGIAAPEPLDVFLATVLDLLEALRTQPEGRGAWSTHEEYLLSFRWNAAWASGLGGDLDVVERQPPVFGAVRQLRGHRALPHVQPSGGQRQTVGDAQRALGGRPPVEARETAGRSRGGAWNRR